MKLFFLLGLVTLSFAASPARFDLDCELCQDAVKAVQEVVDDPEVQSEVKGALDQICAALPGQYGTECQNLVNEYFPQLIQAIDSLLPEVCSELGLCSSSTHPAKKFFFKKPIQLQELDCELCTDAQTALKQIVDDPSVQAAVKGVAEEFCNGLPGKIGDECKSLVDEYFPQLIQFLDQQIPGLCKELGLCPSATQLHSVFGVTCDVCNEAVNVIKYFLNQDAVQKELSALLDQACDAIPDKPLADACKDTVTHYMPEIVKYINDEILSKVCQDVLHCGGQGFHVVPTQFNEICDVLKEIYNDIPSVIDKAEGVCDSIPDEQLKKDCKDTFEHYKPEIVKMGDDALKWIASHIPFLHCQLPQSQAHSVWSVTCDVCNEAVNVIKYFLNQPQVQAELSSLLDKACDVIPDKPLADACKDTVKQYMPEIAKYINDEILSKMCQDILHCGSAENSRVIGNRFSSVCDVLKQIYADIPSVIDKAEGVCDSIPDEQLKKDCKDTFEHFKPDIVKMADDALKWIASHIPFLHCQLPQSQTAQLHSVWSVTCDVCNEAVDVIKYFLNQPQVQAELSSLLDKACDVIPDKPLADACKDTVKQYMPEIAKYINDEILSKLCQDILHCGSSESSPVIGDRFSSICDVLKEIYADIPSVIDKAEGVCDQIPDDQLKKDCKDTFDHFKPDIVKIADDALQWLAAHIPFVHCKLP